MHRLIAVVATCNEADQPCSRGKKFHGHGAGQILEAPKPRYPRVIDRHATGEVIDPLKAR